MHASVKVLDIDIDMMTNDVFVQKMNEYLSDDKLDVILFASTELLDKAMGEESYREVIEQADLILPGEEALLSAHHVEVLEAGGMVVSCKSFGIMLENLQKKDQSVYIIGKSSTEVEQLETWCKRMQPGLRLSGSVVYDPDMEAAALINEIAEQVLQLEQKNGSYDVYLEEYRRRSYLTGRPVRVYATQPYDAVCMGIDESGGLLVQCKNGECKTVIAGDVSVRATENEKAQDR